MPDPHIDLAWPAYAAEIGRRVATVRRLRHVSQLELAGVTGVSRTQLQNIEQSKSFKNDEAGNTTLRTLFVIAQALGVPPTMFIPAGAPQPEYEGAADSVLERVLGEELARWPLPPTTRPSNRVH